MSTTVNSTDEALNYIFWKMLSGQADMVQLYESTMDQCDVEFHQCDCGLSLLNFGNWKSERILSNNFNYAQLLNSLLIKIEVEEETKENLTMAQFEYDFEEYHGKFALVLTNSISIAREKIVFIFANGVNLTKVIESESKSILTKTEELIKNGINKNLNDFTVLNDLKRITKLLSKHIEKE